MRSVFIGLQVLFTALAVSQAAPVASDDALPPLLANRTQPAGVPAFPGDLNAEQDAIKKNGVLSKLIPQKDGMALVTTKGDITPPASNAANFTVTNATPAQVTDLEFYAALAATAYCRSVVPQGKWDCAHCKTTVPDAKIITTFSTQGYDTNGFIIRSDDKKTIYLVFRGTNSIRNFVLDLEFLPMDYPPVEGGPKVHNGFYRSYEEAAPLLIPVMQDQLTKYPDYQVVAAGHSLGAAEALLAALDLYQRDARFTSKNMRVVTAGCPRVGNPDFAYYVESTGIQFTRIVHRRDVVPHLPTEFMGFLHAGVENWIYKNPADVRICEANIETDMCSNSIAPDTSLLDHLEYFGINEGLCL
ncbi:hypothetical protein DFQ28_002809 [Apophysomyces sp. BC1034]|nr:hypothetical protein DFQ30_006377 [Apophysomyces sp. BC1015]KAG0177471.1 hypothetical protein DFQ29_004794 [Apophysomyces sp. BC1021]KAG0189865.1 hypothetical protein DFQ28_002809 [Apophysomyces sp. BC1034]